MCQNNLALDMLILISRVGFTLIILEFVCLNNVLSLSMVKFVVFESLSGYTLSEREKKHSSLIKNTLNKADFPLMHH